MRHRILRLFGIIVLAGFVCTVGCAWACALWSPVLWPDTRRDAIGSLRGLFAPQNVTPPPRWVLDGPDPPDPDVPLDVESSMGHGHQVISYDATRWMTVRSGWPFVSMSYNIRDNRRPTERITGGVPVRWITTGPYGPPRAAPLLVAWDGFALSWASWSLVAGLFLGGPVVMRWRIRHRRLCRGLCPECRYELVDGACSECGGRWGDAADG